jgi:hypothetical protein
MTKLSLLFVAVILGVGQRAFAQDVCGVGRGDDASQGTCNNSNCWDSCRTPGVTLTRQTISPDFHQVLKQDHELPIIALAAELVSVHWTLSGVEEICRRIEILKVPLWSGSVYNKRFPSAGRHS